jgi:hypothetical protein
MEAEKLFQTASSRAVTHEAKLSNYNRYISYESTLSITSIFFALGLHLEDKARCISPRNALFTIPMIFITSLSIGSYLRDRSEFHRKQSRGYKDLKITMSRLLQSERSPTDKEWKNEYFKIRQEFDDLELYSSEHAKDRWF